MQRVPSARGWELAVAIRAQINLDGWRLLPPRRVAVHHGHPTQRLQSGHGEDRLVQLPERLHAQPPRERGALEVAPRDIAAQPPEEVEPPQLEIRQRALDDVHLRALERPLVRGG